MRSYMKLENFEYFTKISKMRCDCIFINDLSTHISSLSNKTENNIFKFVVNTFSNCSRQNDQNILSNLFLCFNNFV